jgi:predicted metalloprotease with PDZ domain
LIRHRVSLAAHQRRLLTIETLVPVLQAGPVDVTFPVWAPGSYLIREYPRNIHDVTAVLDGRGVPVEKVAKNVYRVIAATTGTLAFRYEVYAHELTVRTCHVDSSHAFLNPVALVPFVPGREAEPQSIEVTDLPAGWDVACALPSRKEDRATAFRASDYDELIDSPLECGPHAAPENRLTLSVRGVPHEIVLWGRSTLDRTRFVADVGRIIEAQAALFGGLPYERFLFIALASDSARGGLEHRASSALLFTRSSLSRAKGYEDFLGLVSHELFHAWNVKRIKPAAFTPYDLTRENPTRLLWAFEGLTSYYEDIFLLRAGLMSRARFLELLAERLTILERTPGRLRHPVSEASYDAWIRYYRQDENSDNSSVSYYLKGSIIGALLDVEIRGRTNGQRSLDDVMRLLWAEHGTNGRGVPENGIEEACVRIAGEGLRPFLRRAIYSTEELPAEEILQNVGLKAEKRIAINADDRGGPPPSGSPLRCDIGLVLRTEGDRVRVGAVRRGTPADNAGLCPGDELIALDGMRADSGSTWARLHDRAPGEPVALTLFRRDELLSVRFPAGQPQLDTWTISEAAETSVDQKNALQAWLPA